MTYTNRLFAVFEFANYDVESDSDNVSKNINFFCQARNIYATLYDITDLRF